MRKVIFTVLVLSIQFPLLLSANDYLGLGPRAGYYKTTDADNGEWMIGAGLRLKMGFLGFEGSIDYRAEKYANGLLTVRSWPVMASLLIYPLPVIYGVAGAGWYNTTFDYDQNKMVTRHIEDETSQEIGWHFGGGIELPLGKKTKLAADIRYVFIDYDFSEVPGSSELESDFYAITITLFWGL